MAKQWYQQGDVIIEPQSIPRGRPAAARSAVIAEGEATGHTHRVRGNAQVVEIDGALYVDAAGQITVEHEEHQPITLPPGEYKVRRVLEFDHFAEEARSVAD